MASDTLSGLLEAVKCLSANLTENTNFAIGGGGGVKWHLEYWSPTWLETSEFSFPEWGGGGQSGTSQ